MAGEAVEIVEAGSNKNLAEDAKGAVIAFQAEAGKAYLVRRRGAGKMSFAAVDGAAAQTAKRLGKVQIGIFSAEAK